MKGGPEVGLAGQTYTVGPNRLAFGVIDAQGQFVYGKTAVYVAPSPDAKARGPYPGAGRRAGHRTRLTAPARRRARPTCSRPSTAPRCASQARPLVGADRDAGRRRDARRADAGQGRHAAPRTRSPRSARPPRRSRRTRSPRPRATRSRSTRASRPRPSCTRSPSPTWSGKKPVALLFATPQLCQSRVCGPVTDIALQMQGRSTATRWTFIHQEVYVDNDPNKGLRQPLQEFNLQLGAVAVRRRRRRQGHRPARGLVRPEGVRASDQDRALSRCRETDRPRRC